MDMKFFDIFNGDADGICALHQLRLADPRPNARLITGVKRDVRLLKKLTGIHNASLTVLDVSLDSNREPLLKLLENGCKILYLDHHFSGSIPESANLTTHIDPDPDTCTSMIANRLLEGKYSSWAVVGAFGDNLHKSALGLGAELQLPDTKIAQLKELGELLNYNGYGASESDLFYHPQDLYREISPFPDPFAFLEESTIPSRLKIGFREDMQLASSYGPIRESESGRIFELPPEKWARRVSGVYSNLKAQEAPGLAHGLLTHNPDETYRISVRAPLVNKKGADTVCRAFATGGGRAAAAGINSLPPDQLKLFFKTFDEVFGSNNR
jgi:hypothetical protein